MKSGWVRIAATLLCGLVALAFAVFGVVAIVPPWVWIPLVGLGLIGLVLGIVDEVRQHRIPTPSATPPTTTFRGSATGGRMHNVYSEADVVIDMELKDVDIDDIQHRPREGE